MSKRTRSGPGQSGCLVSRWPDWRRGVQSATESSTIARRSAAASSPATQSACRSRTESSASCRACAFMHNQRGAADPPEAWARSAAANASRVRSARGALLLLSRFPNSAGMCTPCLSRARSIGKNPDDTVVMFVTKGIWGGGVTLSPEISMVTTVASDCGRAEAGQRSSDAGLSGLPKVVDRWPKKDLRPLRCIKCMVHTAPADTEPEGATTIAIDDRHEVAGLPNGWQAILWSTDHHGSGRHHVR